MFCSDVIDHRIYKLLVTFYKIHFLYTVIHFCIIQEQKISYSQKEGKEMSKLCRKL